MMQAFNDLEFSAEHQDNIFRTLAGILNLGNVSFEENKSKVRKTAGYYSACASSLKLNTK